MLTKPLGIGILTSGIKFNRTSQAGVERAIQVMSTLNRAAAQVMLRYDSHAATDITGNGLLGHAYELARPSNLDLCFRSKDVPFIEEAYSLAESGLLPRIIANTWKMIADHTEISPAVTEALRNILVDPQTSGGLLISVNAKDVDVMLAEMRRPGLEAARVGRVEEFQGRYIKVE